MLGRAVVALLFLCFSVTVTSVRTDAATATDGRRGIVIEIVPETGDGRETIELYAASHALVVGIDDYRGGWPDLRNAIADARAVADALWQRGFSVDLMENPDSRVLREAFRRFYIEKGADPDARLFLWFAGHGHTIDGEGFLVPADGATPDRDVAFRSTALHLREIGNYARLARARHSFAVFDSCFAGTIFGSTRSLPPPAIRRAVLNPVRQFMTSGGADQEVADDGLFRRLFIEALEGTRPADANGDGYLTGSELGLFLGDALSNYTSNLQVPQFGPLRDPAWDKGDFVFLLDGVGSDAASPVGTDALVWNSIRDSRRADDFRLFIETYPESPLLPYARARRAALAGPAIDVRADRRTLFVTVTAANLRAAPGTAHPKVGLLRAGDQVLVTGRVADRPWLRVRQGDGTEAFLHAGLVGERVLDEKEPEVRRRRPGEIFSDCTECPPMQVVEEGRFYASLKSPGQPLFEVPAPFALGVFEVTLAEWDACVAGGGCNGYRPDRDRNDRERVPAYGLSWQDANAYLDWLSDRTGHRYRLPRDAEWEFVATARGRVDAGVVDETMAEIVRDERRIGTSLGDVSERAPNEAGIFGMNGGVREWMSDCRSGTDRPDCPAYSVRGPANAAREANRRDLPRVWVAPDTRASVIGFRVARDLLPSEMAQP